MTSPDIEQNPLRFQIHRPQVRLQGIGVAGGQRRKNHIGIRHRLHSQTGGSVTELSVTGARKMAGNKCSIPDHGANVLSGTVHNDRF
jgi:hypothetical protein